MLGSQNVIIFVVFQKRKYPLNIVIKCFINFTINCSETIIYSKNSFQYFRRLGKARQTVKIQIKTNITALFTKKMHL